MTRAATLPQMLAVFLKMGMASFGGGLPGWMHQVVEKRGWMTEDSFLAGVALVQVMPGANSVNLALYIGQHLRGAAGLVVCGFGVLFPPFIVILLMASAYGAIANIGGVQFVLSGVAAAGVGMTLVIGAKTARRLRGVAPVAIAGVIFTAIGILHLPLLAVLLVMGSGSVAWAWWDRAWNG